jgi:type 1 fimbria pilin
MKMMKIMLTVATVLAISIGPALAGEGDASINISGTIRDNTCYVSPDSQSKEVELGNVSAHQFQKTGDASAVQPFSINLEDCGGSINTISVTFSGEQDSDNPQLLAIDSAEGKASGVAVAIYDQTRTLLPLGLASTGYALETGVTTTSLSFFARYLSTQDTVTSGSAEATATFVVNYE